MLPEGGGFWEKWLEKYAERVRLLCALQEDAIRRQDWSELQQLSQEQEHILDVLWQAPPSQLPPEILAFARDLWQRNQYLQQMMEEHMDTLRADMASLYRMRDTVQRYRTSTSTGSLEDRAV
jgi:hypothetical protein